MSDNSGGLDKPSEAASVKGNQVVALSSKQTLSHAECVEHAAEYISKRYQVTLPEFFCHNAELPDVIGFSRDDSVVVECKVSRGDFLSDKKKSFRINPDEGMGDRRYYCCPKDLIKQSELPEGWGLLYIYPSGVVREIKGSYIPTTEPIGPDSWKYTGQFKKNIKAELYLLFYYARRANFAGVHTTILNYRGYDS